MDGAEMVAVERARQISEEGWTADHDDRHSEGELAVAASIYASPFVDPGRPWPWESESDKAAPKVYTYAEYEQAMRDPQLREQRVRELTKAAALVCAEIDRLRRLS